VESASGERWDLALDLLRQGGHAVQVGGTRLRHQQPLGGVLLRRDTVGPRSDARIHVAVMATRDRPTRQFAVDEVSAGRHLIDELCAWDPRLALLFSEFGSKWT